MRNYEIIKTCLIVCMSSSVILAIIAIYFIHKVTELKKEIATDNKCSFCKVNSFLMDEMWRFHYALDAMHAEQAICNRCRIKDSSKQLYADSIKKYNSENAKE